MEEADGDPRRTAYRRGLPMVCEYKGQQELLNAVRQTIRQELRGAQLTKEEAQDSGGAGDVDESVLGFLLALQEGDEMT